MLNVMAGTDLPDSGLNVSIQEVLQNLNELITEETNTLDTGRQEPLQELAVKKLRLLTQLQSLTASVRIEDITMVNRFEINKLKSTLIENVKKLDLRIKAINELAGTIESAVRENESDGTYSAGQFRNEYD
ncbi:MAG: hypothetical protein AAF478_12725 [Pseudomonadota bacterium]